MSNKIGLLTKASFLGKLSPYMLYLKLGFIAALFLSGVFVGCRMDEPDCSVQDKARTELITEVATLRAANAEYERVESIRNEQARQEQAAQAAREAAAGKEVEAARKRAQTLQGELDAIEARQQAAKKDPKCRDIMELEVCPALL